MQEGLYGTERTGDEIWEGSDPQTKRMIVWFYLFQYGITLIDESPIVIAKACSLMVSHYTLKICVDMVSRAMKTTFKLEANFTDMANSKDLARLANLPGLARSG